MLKLGNGTDNKGKNLPNENTPSLRLWFVSIW